MRGHWYSIAKGVATKILRSFFVGLVKESTIEGEGYKSRIAR